MIINNFIASGRNVIINNAGNSIVSLSYIQTNFTLSCVTSGVPAVHINKKCHQKQPVGFSQYVLDPVSMKYNSVLAWGSQYQDHYICSSRSRRITSVAVLLTEVGAGKTSIYHSVAK